MEINLFSMFITVAIAHFLALLSPGPDFVLVVKSAIRNSSNNAIGAAAGIAFANAVYICICLIGVGAILAAHTNLMIALKLAGGLFLMYLGAQALRAKKQAYLTLCEQSSLNDGTASSGFFIELFTGFLSGILNPKNLLFYLSLFTVVLTNEVGFGFKLGLGIWMTLVVFAWDTTIILLLSTEKMRTGFTRFAFYIDKVTGALLGLIGGGIVKSAILH